MGPGSLQHSLQHAGKKQGKKEAGTLCQFLPVMFTRPRATSPPVALPSRGPESRARQLGLKPDAWRGSGSIPELAPLEPAVQGGTQRKVGQ